MPDASSVGVGGVLLQDQGQGLKPCAYLSSKLTDTQKKRGAYETELWALVRCFQQWKHYLCGTYVEVRTDHAPLKYIDKQIKMTDKVARWLDFLSEFNFDGVHVPGVRDAFADGLSRNPAFYVPHIYAHLVHIVCGRDERI